MAEGYVFATKRDNGTVCLHVEPGALKVSFGLLATAEPEWLEIRDGLVIFRGIEDDGKQQLAVYRPTGVEQGPEGGWLLCEPVA